MLWPCLTKVKARRVDGGAGAFASNERATIERRDDARTKRDTAGRDGAPNDDDVRMASRSAAAAVGRKNQKLRAEGRGTNFQSQTKRCKKLIDYSRPRGDGRNTTNEHVVEPRDEGDGKKHHDESDEWRHRFFPRARVVKRPAR